MSSKTRLARLGAWLAVALAIPACGVVLASSRPGEEMHGSATLVAERPAPPIGQSASARDSFHKMPIGSWQPFAE